uniref:DOG1 domain-containing protein n=1 Tax=Kalanchoe fedtschenkoi TaxID=63787 RepID=A0A7N0T7Z6_KALFE
MLSEGESSSSGDAHSCFEQWMDLQKSDLSDLMQALSRQTKEEEEEEDSCSLDDGYSELLDKSIQHFEEYMKDRCRLAQRDTAASSYLAPGWCSTLENSLLWIGGCRPSIFIRLTYALCRLESENHPSQAVNGEETKMMADLTSQQISEIDALRSKTVLEEDKLATRLASLQEDVGDYPLAAVAVKCSDQVADMSSIIEKALESHEKCLVKVLEEADKLRMSTLKELLLVLKPKQGVDLLAAGKKIHLSLHEWGKVKDAENGSRN